MTLVDNQLFDGEEQESTKMVQLSLMAYFDDMCRYQNYLSSYDRCKFVLKLFKFNIIISFVSIA